MEKTIPEFITRLEKEAKQNGAAEYSTLVEFFSDYVESNPDCDIAMIQNICDEFISWAAVIKVTSNEVGK